MKFKVRASKLDALQFDFTRHFLVNAWLSTPTSSLTRS